MKDGYGGTVLRVNLTSGETLEAAAKREFFEETGLQTNINCLLATYS